jgi:hypothetical protein
MAVAQVVVAQAAQAVVARQKQPTTVETLLNTHRQVILIYL